MPTSPVVVGGNAGEVLETFMGLPCMDGGFACMCVEDNALQSLAVVMARAGVSWLFTHARRRDCLLHLPW